jgi:hypothetical protein
MKLIIASFMALAAATQTDGCDSSRQPIESASGARRIAAKVQKNADGTTVEQANIRERLAEDNRPGTVKHLYVMSAYSGQTLIYSTVKGKVTSSGKRLTPTTVEVSGGEYSKDGFPTGMGDTETGEVLQDDGTYGHSVDYLYWWDTKGVYHQHYIQGGQILHISSEPISVKSVVINMELGDNQVAEEYSAKPRAEKAK